MPLVFAPKLAHPLLLRFHSCFFGPFSFTHATGGPADQIDLAMANRSADF